MKKLVVVLVLVCVAAGLTAQMDLGSFPVGKWTDANWDAVWSFASDKIVLEKADGSGMWYDFSQDATIEQWEVTTTSEGLQLSFFCVETGKHYYFIKGVTSMDLILRIKWKGYDDYEVTMKMK